jgi:hypothetical protein
MIEWSECERDPCAGACQLCGIKWHRMQKRRFVGGKPRRWTAFCVCRRCFLDVRVLHAKQKLL